jgi:hypothetical protein
MRKKFNGENEQNGRNRHYALKCKTKYKSQCLHATAAAKIGRPGIDAGDGDDNQSKAQRPVSENAEGNGTDN